LKGRKAYGDRTGLEVKELYGWRGLAVLTDFHDVLAKLLRNLLGFEHRAESRHDPGT
jgi:hypothetical protein